MALDNTNTPGPGVGNENSPAPLAPAGMLPLGAAPAAPNIPVLAPDLSGLAQLGGDDVAPPVAASSTGVSPSPQQQLAQQMAANAHNLMATSKDPNAPMGWAKAWMASAMGALGDAGSIGSTPENLTSGLGGAMYGISKAMGARNERMQRQKEFDAQQKQQDIINQREDRKLKDQEEEQNYMIAQHKISIGMQQRAMTEADSKYIYDKIYAPWKKGEGAQGAALIKENMSQAELSQLASQHANSVTDPKGIKWLKDQDVRQDGVRMLMDAEGKPIPEIGSDGKPTGEYKTEPTFGAFTYGDPHTMDETFAKDLKDHDIATHFSEGDKVPARDYAYLKVKLGDMMADELNADKIALAAGTTKQGLEELKKKAEYPAAVDALSHWTADAGNPIEGYENLQRAAEAPDDGTQTGAATKAKAQEQLKAVQDAFGVKILNDAIDEHFKGQIEQIKANAAAAKNKPQELEGNPNLSGEEYIKSLPLGRQAIVRGMANGNISVGGSGGLQRMLSSKDGQLLFEEAAQADPNLDTSKIAAYVDAYKKFTTDTKIAGQLNSARTAFRHFQALYDDNNLPGSFVGGPNYAKRQADITDASTELARFLTGGTAPSQDEIAKARESLDPSVFRTLDPHESKQTALKSQSDRIREKVEEYMSQWSEAMPSPRWNKQMPGWDKAAQDAMNYVRYDGKPPVGVGGPTASPAAGAAGAGGGAPAFTLTLPNGRVATFQSQKQMDDARAALAKAMVKVQ